MVEHVVLFKWNQDATPETIAAAMEGLRSLKEQIPGIVDLTCGENYSDRSQGFQCGLVVHFVNRNAMESYLTHPAHRRVVENLLSPIRAETIVVDYDV